MFIRNIFLAFNHISNIKSFWINQIVIIEICTTQILVIAFIPCSKFATTLVILNILTINGTQFNRNSYTGWNNGIVAIPKSAFAPAMKNKH